MNPFGRIFRGVEYVRISFAGGYFQLQQTRYVVYYPRVGYPRGYWG